MWQFFFFLQNCIYLRKQPYCTTKSFVVEGIQRSDPWNFPKFYNSCMETWKIGTFWSYFEFWSQIVGFIFITKLRLFPKKAFLKTNLFLVERIWSSKPPSLSKNTQKLHKSFKNLNFQVFCQFRSTFDGFFQHKLNYLFKEASWTTNFFLV